MPVDFLRSILREMRVLNHTVTHALSMASAEELLQGAPSGWLIRHVPCVWGARQDAYSWDRGNWDTDGNEDCRLFLEDATRAGGALAALDDTVEVGAITTPLTVNGGVSRTWGRTWNSPWSTPGGDYVSIGTASLTAGTPVSITGGAVASAIQAMIDGGPTLQNILIRKTNSDYTQVNVTASVDVEFDVVG